MTLVKFRSFGIHEDATWILVVICEIQQLHKSSVQLW